MPRGSSPGERRGGRAKGTPNHITVHVRTAIELAFEGIGGVPALTAWAEQNRDLFYTRIWTRILPREITASIHTDLTASQE